MNICSTHLKLKHKSNICDFEGILKTECNLQHLTSELRICMTLKEMRQTHRGGPLNVKEKGIIICYIMNRCLLMFFKRRDPNVCSDWLKNDSLCLPMKRSSKCYTACRCNGRRLDIQRPDQINFAFP